MMFPHPFIESIVESMGEECANVLLKALDEEPSISIRINPSKIHSPLEELDLPFAEEPLSPLSQYGYILDVRPSFTEDPFLHCGAYYVQEASSMAIEVAQTLMGSFGRPLRVLDLCAAPGGKSTHLLSLLRRFPGSFLVSNEVIRSRATILSENIAKWGAPNVVVTNNDPADFTVLPSYFDVVLVDAPCSGEGMFRKDHKAREEWTLENVDICAARQRRIVSDIWGSLKDDGLLIYSTCTFNKKEDDENVEWMINEFSAEALVVQRFFPGNKGCGEGFFMAILRKHGNNGVSSKIRIPRVEMFRGKCDFVQSGYTLIEKGGLLKAYPTNVCNEMLSVEYCLRTIRAGIAVAEKKGDLLIPEAELALSEALNPEAFNVVDVNKNEALRFLSKEPLCFAEASKGYLLLKYKGLPLGFVKNIGNRSNNLWPQGWRIRQTINLK